MSLLAILREGANDGTVDPVVREQLGEAADEIERLERERDALLKAVYAALDDATAIAEADTSPRITQAIAGAIWRLSAAIAAAEREATE